MEAEAISTYILGKPWMIVVIMISLSLIAFIRFNYNKIQRIYFQTIFDSNLPSEFVDEEKVLTHRASLFLLANSAIVLSLFLTLLGHRYLDNIALNLEFGEFFIVFLIICFTFILKVLFLSFFKVLIEQDAGIQEYMLNNSFINMILGLILLPILIFCLFTNQLLLTYFLGAALVVFVGFQVFKFLKALLIQRKNRINPYYFILYLCCFEIAPLLVLFKELYFKAG